MYISCILKNYMEEQYEKIDNLEDIRNIEGLISFKIIKNKRIIEKLEQNNKDYGCYFV